MSDETLVRLPERGHYSKAHLIDPVESGYIPAGGRRRSAATFRPSSWKARGKDS